MDNELMNEETTKQTTEENSSGDAADGETGGNDNNAETGGEEQGSEAPAASADGEQQEAEAMTEVTGTVTVDNLYERPIMSTPFSQYTVTEGLLLLSLLLGLVRTMFRIWNN